MQQAGESKETGALSAPENPKSQVPNPKEIPSSEFPKKERRRVGLFWLLGFEICLGFGFWDLGFPT
jgi:hypothetical protein